MTAARLVTSMVSASGTFRHDQEMYLAARSYQSQLGYHVVTPLILDDGNADYQPFKQQNEQFEF